MPLHANKIRQPKRLHDRFLATPQNGMPRDCEGTQRRESGWRRARAERPLDGRIRRFQRLFGRGGCLLGIRDLGQAFRTL